MLFPNTMTVADSSLAAAMWASLRTLAASHVAMYTVAQPSAAWTVLSNDANEIRLRNLRGTLRWTAPGESGAGTWQISTASPSGRSAHGRYEFTDEGLLRFDEEEEPLEIEAAVERCLQPLQETERRA